mgnify:CR=1 FL=1
MQMPSSAATSRLGRPCSVTIRTAPLEAHRNAAALGVFVLWLTFFITPFHYTDCFSVRQIGYGGNGHCEFVKCKEKEGMQNVLDKQDKG